MSLKICIPGMVERGEITPEQGRQMEAVYDEIEAKYAPTMSATAAATKASQEALDTMAAEVFQRKRQAVMQIAAQRTAADNMAKYPGSLGEAAMALYDMDSKATYSNVEARRKAVLGRSHAMMEGVLARHRRRITGQVRDAAGLRDIVREAFGESSGNLSAKELADAWGQTAEMLRRRFNAAGGAIGKLEKWGLPQSHSAVKVVKAGYEAWKEFIEPLLDPTKMVDDVTGRPITPQALQATLRRVYDTVRTEGWNKREPGAFRGLGKLANRRADSRFLVFKDADSWLSYNERFGDATPFDAMMGHISGMSRDIAMMEVLGPNPAATTRWIKDLLEQRARVSETADVDAAKSAAKRVQEMYDTISGAASTPINTKLAMRFGAVRSVLTSAMLGRAAISALTDTAFQALTRGFNGLPLTGALTGYAKLLRPYMSKDQKLAIRLGLIAEEASKMASAQNRYIGESVGPELASRLADGVLRASGLSAWTQAGRWAFGMETLGFMADNADRPFSKLNPAFRGMLERYGIGGAEWQSIRSTPLFDERGSSFLRPQDIKDQTLGDRVLEMVLTETDYAVPAATVRARSFMNVGQSGTWMGEIFKSALLFKSFGVSMLLTHGRRLVEQQGFNRFRYAAALAVTTTLMGAVAMQMKEVSKGRDPRPMTGPEFWGAAMMQGGGFGVFGDFITSTENRYGGGLAGTVAGPVAGLAGDIGGLAWSGFKAAQGEETNLGRDAVRMVGRYTPGGSLWYASLAFQRGMLDQIQMLADDDYFDSFNRMERYAEKTGQEYWWRPGERTPERAPDYVNALAEAPQ